MELHEPDRATISEVGRASLRLWEWGDPGLPTVICVHGAFDHGRMFDGLAPTLVERGFHVIAPDLRGHGDSSRLSSGHAWEAVAFDLALLAERHGGAGFVGHSFGGGQALFVAAVWPETVRWVVNLDGLGPPATAFADVDLAEGARAGFDALDRLRVAPPRVYATVAEAAERRRRINLRLPEPWLEHLVLWGTEPVDGGVRWKADPMFNIGFPDSFDTNVLMAQYRMVQCPVLVLTGTEPDTWSDLGAVEVAERVEALRATHVEVAGAGHYLHLEAPNAVVEQIDRFLTVVGS